MYIRRKSEEALHSWQLRNDRKPLIIRGARQTGKSRLVNEYGRENFKHVVVLNLEKEPELRRLFETADTGRLINEIELIKNTPVIPGKTLLFIDEIQQSPSAITKLRYFYEDKPELHVIAAGSLLEFVLDKENLSFPVGRVEFHYLFPLSFEEYLRGAGEEKLLLHLAEVGSKEKISQLVHQKLREHLKDYLLIGGMPEATAKFLESKRHKDCEPIWESIFETYREDFKKYSRRVNVENIERAFQQIPGHVGKEINLTKFGQGIIGAREVKTALSLLQRAMIVQGVHCVKEVSFPLIPSLHKRSKFVFLDLGLVQYINRISAEIVQSQNYSSIYKGGFAEQFVGQELLPLIGSFRRPELFYWRREKSGGTAEVDYIYPHGSNLLPVEVKSGRSGSLASLHQFMYQHKSPVAIRIYDGELRFEPVSVTLPQSSRVEYNLLSIPLYLIHRVHELCRELV